MLSVVIPAHNEEASIPATVAAIYAALYEAGIAHEVLVVDDHSRDGTWAVLGSLRSTMPTLRPVRNTGPGGFGNAIHFGLQHYVGDRVVVMMADLSDPPGDLVCFDRALHEQGVDCIFGSRAMAGARVEGYPRRKWLANRAANLFLCAVFQYRYNDTTNPFKLYRRSTMDKLLPLRSQGFELEVELPLKAILRGATYAVLPNGWNGREAGESKMRLLTLVVPYMRVVLRALRERFSGKPMVL